MDEAQGPTACCLTALRGHRGLVLESSAAQVFEAAAEGLCGFDEAGDLVGQEPRRDFVRAVGELEPRCALPHASRLGTGSKGSLRQTRLTTLGTFMSSFSGDALVCATALWAMTFAIAYCLVRTRQLTAGMRSAPPQRACTAFLGRSPTKKKPAQSRRVSRSAPRFLARGADTMNKPGDATARFSGAPSGTSEWRNP